MQSSEIRKRFLEFFEKRDHKIVPSSSLIPDDPSVLLTTAGMQQFKPYYTGEADPLKDFGTKNTASIQKSFRTSDIDEVGDESHLTFFEMLGNFSFGGYFKKEAITYAFDFITKELGLPISHVTIFEGSDTVPKDEKSRSIWNSLGITDVREEGMADVFWGPTGSSGPCGPTTEIYCENSAGGKAEVWNLVFNEYFYPGSREELNAGVGGKRLEPLKTPGVDTGMGLERLAMIAQNAKTIFETDLFMPLTAVLPDGIPFKTKRVIADHVRGAAFLLADGLEPSNKEAGYILRRLMRRVLVYENIHKITERVFDAIFDNIVHGYGNFYPELLKEDKNIRVEFQRERVRFSKTLQKGLNFFLSRKPIDKYGRIGAFWDQQRLHGPEAFHLYQTYGFPREIMEELCKEYGGSFDKEGFELELKKHQEISRAGREKKFGGHGLLLDTGELKAGDKSELEKVTRLHTATHLLNAALHRVLGDEVDQRGSDITVERARFDFRFPRKLETDELKEIEDIVNQAIAEDLPVESEEMELEEAKSSGALYFYKGHYPPRVKVYTIGRGGEVFSRELCGGPHVGRTGEIGKFRIVKEESSSAGVRRIRAIVE